MSQRPLSAVTINPNLPWFRFYKDAVDDAKLRLLNAEDRWYFVAILCCKAQGLLDKDADLARVRRAIAIKLGVDGAALDEIERRLVAEGLVQERTLQPLAWDKRQYRSDADPTNAQRQSRHRAKRSNARVTPADTETEKEADKEDGDKSPSNAVAAYSDEFEHAWALYPKRPNNNKATAWRAWQARVAAGVTTIDLIDGARRYQAYCRESETEPRYVKLAATFFGPDEHFRLDWIPVTPLSPRREGSARMQHRADWIAGADNQENNYDQSHTINV